jgi:nitrous oxide reductase
MVKPLAVLISMIALTSALFTGCSAELASKPATRSFTLIGGAEVGRDGKPYFTPGHLDHAFFGRDGDIDGRPNPTLYVNQGEKVEITLLNLDERGQPHVLAIPSLGLETPTLTKNGESATITFIAKDPGTFDYNGRTVFGGRERHVHMEGRIVVRPK